LTYISLIVGDHAETALTEERGPTSDCIVYANWQ